MNRLAGSLSPYLRQHADNPVHWHEWGDAAFAEAKAGSRPIFLSIGYSACHWCHVMARESFSDPEIARLLNDNFVSIKVDREERPDVDAIYMAALQALTGSGGWPLSMVLTPDGEPFFGGTYYPPDDRHGLPAFRRVLTAVSAAWRNQTDAAVQTAGSLVQHLQKQFAPSPGAGPAAGVPDQARDHLIRLNREHPGGFGGAPRFPAPAALGFLLASGSGRDAALDVLRSMTTGGIFDQLGGGFARYSVDDRWTVPHFEKMLNDNGQLLGTVAAAWGLSGEPVFGRAARLTAGWLLDGMRNTDGVFHSALSAESGGVEGGYYSWSAAEFAAVAPGMEAEFGVTEAGNFDGRNVLTLQNPENADSPELEAARARLLASRDARPAPDTDHKVLTGWNGLAIHGLALAGRLLQEPEWVRAAAAAWEWFASRPDSHGFAEGSTLGPPQLEDHAAMGIGLISLYEATLDPRHLNAAARHADVILDSFSQDGVLYSVPAGTGLIVRPRQLLDAGGPADVPLAARLLLRIGRLQDREDMVRAADTVLAETGRYLVAEPVLSGTALRLAAESLQAPSEVILAGPDVQELAAAAQSLWLPHVQLLGPGLDSDTWPVVRGRESAALPTAWHCRDRTCLMPVHEPGDLLAQLR